MMTDGTVSGGEEVEDCTMPDDLDASADEEPKGYTLPDALAPFADESLIGLVVRTAQGRRFHDPMRLFRRIKPRSLSSHLWTFCQQDPQSEDGQAVGRLLGLDPLVFTRMSMWTGNDATLSVQGWPVWNELVRNKAHSVCSLCLQEASYHRASWLVNALPVCAVHGVWLRDVCHNPDCRRPLSWSGTGIHRCGNRRCRHDLRQAPVEHCEPSLLGGITALTDILNSADASAGPLGIPPGVAIRMAFDLGKMSFGLERSARTPGFIRRERVRMPAIMDAGWNALADWPNGFHALLDRQRTRATERPGRDGLHKVFGVLARRIYGWAREPWGAPFGVAFAEYALGCAELRTTSNILRRYAPDDQLRHLHLSRGEAQRLLGLAPNVMQAIAERRDMFVLPPRGSGVPALLRADHVRQIQDEMRDLIMPEQARAMVGVGVKAFNQLEADGLVRRVPEEEHLIPSRPYRRSEVQAFIAACVGKAPRATRAAADAAGLTPLVRASMSRCTLPEICRMLMSGQLRSAATVADAQGLTKVRVRMSDLQRIFPSGRETQSICDVAGLIGINSANLYVWAKRGFLETYALDRPRERGLRVSQDAIERFRRDYISAGDLPALLKQSKSKWLSYRLALVGAMPVSGPGIDEGVMTLFRRADITPEVIRAVGRVGAGCVETTQEKKRKAAARVMAAVEVVAAQWNTQLKRAKNRFTDPATGRVLQVVSGRRPFVSDRFSFMINTNSLIRLQALPDVWLALVPSVGDTLILVPLREVAWRGLSLKGAYVTLRFDRTGTPLDMPEWALPMTNAVGQRTGVTRPKRRVNG